MIPAELSADSSLGRIPSNGDQQRMDTGFGCRDLEMGHTGVRLSVVW